MHPKKDVSNFLPDIFTTLKRIFYIVHGLLMAKWFQLDLLIDLCIFGIQIHEKSCTNFLDIWVLSMMSIFIKLNQSCYLLQVTSKFIWVNLMTQFVINFQSIKKLSIQNGLFHIIYF